MKVVVVFHIPEVKISAENSHASLVIKAIKEFLYPYGYKWSIWKIVNDGDKEDVF